MLIDSLYEEKTLACLMRSNEFTAVAAPHVTNVHFEGAMRQNMAKLALDFFKAFGTHITDLAFVEEVKKLALKGTIKKADALAYGAEYKRLKSLDLSDWEYVLKEVITFVRNRETRLLIEDAIKNLLPKNEFETIEKRWNEIMQISTRVNVEPFDYYSDAAIEARRVRREEEKAGKIKGISTRIKKLDELLPKGGWCPKELYAISGAAKRG